LHSVHAHAHSEDDESTRDHDFFCILFLLLQSVFCSKPDTKDPSTISFYISLSNTFLSTYLGAFLLILSFGEWLLGLAAVSIEHLEATDLLRPLISRQARSGNTFGLLLLLLLFFFFSSPKLYQEARLFAIHAEDRSI
jgi:hypothetical protein